MENPKLNVVDNSKVDEPEGTCSGINTEEFDSDRHIRGVIEAVLFVNEKPVTLDQFKKAFETVNGSEIKKAIQALCSEYEEKKRGVVIVEVAGGYQMRTSSCYAAYVRNFYATKRKEKLSKPALEAIAIVAYRQPVTRSDIEIIRGVNSDGVVAHLLNKELIKVAGRKNVPGKPYLYGITKKFLEYFGLKSLEDLPKLEEFPELDPSEKEISREQQKGEVSADDSEKKKDVQLKDKTEDNVVTVMEAPDAAIETECECSPGQTDAAAVTVKEA